MPTKVAIDHPLYEQLDSISASVIEAFRMIPFARLILEVHLEVLVCV